MTKKEFSVNDMHCPNCAMRIEGIEDILPGIKQISASYTRGKMTVEFDETKVSVSDIIEAVKQVGYTVQAS